ncbi:MULTISPECIES: TonB-dependent receptor [unclassified Arcicella]|uniref:SusC/RagA family TonB-linked outer membrane protein n=1 Tax=unclassified Arcicella TaxID=2644986 RepID=UPI00285BF2F5|nr:MULTISPECIES: TonB-dependent receptor [unclassified Arcicella]MDR6564057.1 TonB-linked SusC/RagA family outer membrane protein [Arcicella sp. BE51]MDR6813810.1 TonB-linked SusC/RagA family outer membrane protein [Arcicella sp. BE140]MDR6825122.1 TonB-linked SusC/RagA family outer membrane protein [Arcicella sp. BE139]
MKFKNYLCLLLLSMCTLSVFGQSVEIRGKVIDANSNVPISGVSIKVKNSTKGTTTNATGEYQINATPNDILIFSFIGYKPLEKAVGNTTLVNVKLEEDIKDLNEVVVIGYGTQKKSVVTGAISSVKAKDLENVPSGRIETALQGRVSGVTIAANAGQPGSASTVRVRGLTTFDTYGGNNPLWVIDGVIIDNGGIGFINQSDIESIEVLKDAASLAIYGARAASGVILVSTKRGKSGKLSVNYTGFVGSSEPAKQLKLLNASEYGLIMNEKSVAAGGSVLFPNPSSLGTGTDWQAAIFNNSAKRSNHELSISGGNDVSSFFLSVGTQSQEGIVLKDISSYRRDNIRLNSNHKLSKYISIGQTLAYSHQKTVGLGNTNSEFGGPLSSAINLDPITPLVVTDPTAAASTIYTTNPVLRDSEGRPYGISSIVGQEMTNPIAYQQVRLGNFDSSDDFVGNAFLEVTPVSNLKFKSTIGAKLSYWGGDFFTPKYYLSATTSAIKNTFSRGTNNGLGWNVENTVMYNKKVSNHNIGVLLGQGLYIDNITTGTSITYSDLPVNTYPDASFNFSLPAAQRTGSAYTGTEHRVTSLFGRLTYDFNEKYLFTGIIRRDGSSRFGGNNKYGIFPSFSAGWVVSNENFWKENGIVKTLKIRSGYGVTGNDAILNFGYLSTIVGGRNYTYGTGGVDIITGFSPSAPSNPDLKWEETAQTNIGIDATLLNNLTLTLEVYRKKTSGILQTITLPGYVGATSSPVGNVADMENKGIELELGYRKRFGDFNFSANGNVSYLKNEVTYLGNGISFITSGAAGFQSMGSITRTQVGQPYNSFFGFQTAGIFQNAAEVSAYKNAEGNVIQPNAKPGDFRWVDTDGNGTINDDDKKFLGSGLPKYTIGLTVNMDYKGFDCMIFAQASGGNKVFQGLRRLDILNANYQTEVLNRWTGEGTSNSYPRLTNNDTNGNFGKPSDFYLEDGDFVRFKIIQLGYTLPTSITNKIGAQKLRLFLTAENLLTITKYTGYDPEIGGNVFGIDRGYYPQARSIQFGLNLKF